MSQPSGPKDSQIEEAPPVDRAAVRDVAAWLTHLVRTLKTCRLYDSNNPTVVRFREELGEGLRALLAQYGAVKLEVGSRDLHYEGAEVYAARSRDDNLAATFHRDGIRAITFLPGIEPREVESMVDLILRVTGPENQDDDLVTLLWDANQPNLVVVSVPLEGDVDGGGEDDVEASSRMPWPAQGDVAAAPGVATGVGMGANGPSAETRSDDWERVHDFANAASLTEIEASGAREIARFQQEHEVEIHGSVVGGMLSALAEALDTVTTPEDRAEIARFLPRVLREAMVLGEWQTASALLGHLRACDSSWTVAGFFEGHATTSSLVTRKAIEALDRQGDEQVELFLALARDLGADSVEWLMTLLAESQQKRVRRPLARAIADLVKDNPERILPWMSDERWYVVRNVVHILGWVGGGDTVGYLKAAVSHPEPRVRRETVAALTEAPPEIVRPILLAMLDEAESRLFGVILQQVSQEPHPAVAERLTQLLKESRFLERSEDERRAVYLGLANQGDLVLGALEDELQRGGLFARGLDPHWQSIARSLARIGTDSARQVLARGRKSAKPGVRKACELALSSLGEAP